MEGGGNGRMGGDGRESVVALAIIWVPPVSCEGNYCFFKMQQSVEIRNLAINFLSFSFIMYFSGSILRWARMQETRARYGFYL